LSLLEPDHSAVYSWLRAAEDGSLALKAAGPPPGYGGGPGYGTGGPIFGDAFGSRRAPTATQLVEAYKSVVYACANLNAQGVARVPLRLYASTADRQARPKCGTRPIGKALASHLRRTTKAARSAEIDEVVEHPLLEALDRANRDFDANLLVLYTVLCLEVLGTAYLLPSEGPLGIPDELWPLQAQYVSAEREGNSALVSRYRYFAETYEPDELIRVRRVSLRDPYGSGYPPAQAAFEYVGLGDKFVSIQENLLANGVRPSVIVSPKDPNMPLGPHERSRFESDANRKFSGPGAGRAWVIDGAVEVHPLTFPPSDLAELQISDNALVRVANCFGVPISLLKTEDVNRANAEAGLYQHALYGLSPLCTLIASALTRWARGFSEGRAAEMRLGWDRLFFAFDNPVPEDEERRARVFDVQIKNGSLLINEARGEEGLPPVAWGDEPWFSRSLVQPSAMEEDRERAALEEDGDEGFDNEGEDFDDGEDEDDGDDPSAEEKAYNPDQPRDEDGRWVSGPGGPRRRRRKRRRHRRRHGRGRRSPLPLRRTHGPKAGGDRPDRTDLHNSSKLSYPGTLERRFTGSFDDLTKSLRELDPGFKGFVGNVKLSDNLAGRYNDQLKRIEFAVPLEKASRGLVAEEVRHFLDEAELGVTRSGVNIAWLTHTRNRIVSDRNVYLWHHRRLFTRMIRDIDDGHPIARKILGPSDVESLHEAYRLGAFGKKSLDWLRSQKFEGPY
jgi:HK97 family phage portal protein